MEGIMAGMFAKATSFTSSAIDKSTKFFVRVWSFILSGLTAIATVIVIYAVFIESWSGSYSIEPIPVPDAVGKAYDKDAYTSLIRDDLDRLIVLSSTRVVIRPVGEDKAPDVNVVGTTFSLSYVISVLRDLFRTQYKKISGNLIQYDGDVVARHPPTEDTALCPGLKPSDPKFRLVLRSSDSPSGPFFSGVGNYVDLAYCGALYTLALIDPLSAASYLGQAEETQPQAFAMLDKALAGATENERSIFPNWLIGNSDIPRAALIRANILLGMKKYPEAKTFFETAANEYSRRHILQKKWYPAFDGIATVFIMREDGKIKKPEVTYALNYVNRALEIDPTYDSALYHKAQIYDDYFRTLLTEAADLNAKANTCDAYANFDKASEVYDSLRVLHPDFEVGYQNHGIMLLQKITYWRTHDNTGCNINNNPEMAKSPDSPIDAVELLLNLRSLEKTANWQFQYATILNHDDADAFYQWGILLDQEQDPGLRRKGETTDLDARRTLLISAIEKFQRAKLLRPTDDYIGQRLEKSQVALTETVCQQFAC
jgi:tetratricopeptide (TPR) repeat protein